MIEWNEDMSKAPHSSPVLVKVSNMITLAVHAPDQDSTYCWLVFNGTLECDQFKEASIDAWADVGAYIP